MAFNRQQYVRHDNHQSRQQDAKAAWRGTTTTRTRGHGSQDFLPGAVKSGAGELTKASAAGYTMLLYARKPFDDRASTTGEAAVFARLAGLLSIEHMAEIAHDEPAIPVSIVNGDLLLGDLQKARDTLKHISRTHLQPTRQGVERNFRSLLSTLSADGLFLMQAVFLPRSCR